MLWLVHSLEDNLSSVKYCLRALLVALALAGAAQAQQADFEAPEWREFEVTPREIVRGGPTRGVDIRGQGDGAARHFFYVIKVARGLLTLQLQARAKSGATSMTVRLEDAEGSSLSQVKAVAGPDDEVMETGTYLLDAPQTVRVHVNIDPNCGPYTVTLTGPLER